MNIQELSGAKLAFEVAIGLNLITRDDWQSVRYTDPNQNGIWLSVKTGGHNPREIGHWEPQRDWKQAGPIIDQFRIGMYFDGWKWAAGFNGASARGDTALIAVMRAFVLRKWTEAGIA